MKCSFGRVGLISQVWIKVRLSVYVLDVGTVEVKRENKKDSTLNAYESIQKQMEKGKIGFKRKYVRC